jgi:enediyne polyketide synthase
LFTAFSSIIGVTGMPGNTWYGFANEVLDLWLRRFQHQHPATQVLSLAYSVWDEIGMGARLGSVDFLARMGIAPIPVAEGVRRFLQLMNFDPGDSQVLIAARLGGLDTWSPTTLPDATPLRFIERVQSVEPGVELIVRTHLSLERDRYIQDHLWRGTYLFPTVFGLEAMLQAAAYVTGNLKPTIARIENVALKYPIVVDPNNGVEIEIRVEAMEATDNYERHVRVSIGTESTGFDVSHFSATIVLGEPTSETQLVLEQTKPLDLDPQTDLYGGLLFQGDRFRRMGTIFSLTSKSTVLQAHVRSEAELAADSFATDLGQCLLLGDPYFRDVLLQSVQLTIPQDICLPVQIERINFFDCPALETDTRVVSALLLDRDGDEYTAEVTATTEQGQIIEQIRLRLRIIENLPQNPTAESLAKSHNRPYPNSDPHSKLPTEIGSHDRHSSCYINDELQGQIVYQQRFQVSFKESGSISRHVYFSQYFRWIGKIRELPMEEMLLVCACWAKQRLMM